MTAVASGEKPNYHVTLSDGVTTIGLLLDNIGGIRQLPRGSGVARQSLAQNTWDGGRGGVSFGSDKTRYYDGLAFSLLEGYLFNPPLATYGTGHRNQTQAMPGNVTWKALTTSTPYLATSFTPSASYTSAKVYLWLRRVGTPATLTVELCADNSGVPGTVLQTATVTTSTITDVLSVLQAFSVAQSLTGGTTYWLKVYDTSSATANHWEIGTDASGSGKESSNGTTWSATTSFYYRVVDGATAPKTAFFFEYKRQLYYVTKPGSGAASLYMNGDRGVATGTQSGTTLQDTSKSWTTNEWAGCVVLNTSTNEYKTIASNTANTLTISGTWTGTPVAATSEYVIVGSNKWTGVSVTLAAPVTDVVVSGNIVYFAMGDSTNVRRYREYNNTGTWTREDADDGTNKATLLITGYNSSGVFSVLKANNDTSAIAEAASTSTWGTDLTFGTATQIGDLDSRINSLAYYDSTWWIGKEDGLFKISSGKAVPMLNAMKTVRDENNCLNMSGWNTNLYFSFQTGWERLYSTTIDDIGPNRDGGMPSNRVGVVADFMPVLQRGYVAYDGGDSNYSCVMATTAPGGSWHELYRSNEAGARITSVFYQHIPNLINRLWVWQGADVLWLATSDDTHNPLNDSQMLYAHEGYIVTAWYDESVDLDHFYDKLRMFTKNLVSGGARRVEVDYQVDGAGDGDTWNRSNVDYSTSPYQTENVGNGAVTGWRIRLRLRFLSSAQATPVVITSMDIRQNVVNEALYDYIIDIREEDRLMLLNGADETATAISVINQLTQWQQQADPLTMTCVVPSFSSATGNIDPISLVPLSWNPKNTSMAGSITFKVIDRSISCKIISDGSTLTVDETKTLTVLGCLQVDGVLVNNGAVYVT
jgi:hypothetical protein